MVIQSTPVWLVLRQLLHNYQCNAISTTSPPNRSFFSWGTNSIRTGYPIHQGMLWHTIGCASPSSGDFRLTFCADRSSVCAVLVSQWFAPTKFVVTVERTEGQCDIFEKDAAGNVIDLTLPDKLVIMANHQVSAANDTRHSKLILTRCTLTGFTYGVLHILPTHMMLYSLFSRGSCS